MKTTVRITLRSNGNSQIYKFNTEEESKEFYESKKDHEPIWKIELI